MKTYETMKKIESLNDTNATFASVLECFAEERCIFCCHKGQCSAEKKTATLDAAPAGGNHKPVFCDDFDFDIMYCRIAVRRALAQNPSMRENALGCPADGGEE